MNSLLDENGKGLLTPELDAIFTTGGCRPSCHICFRYLNLGDAFRLKPFCKKKVADQGGNKQSLAIMVCSKDDESEKKLPYLEFVRVMTNLGFKVPENSRNIPDGLKKKWELFRTSPTLAFQDGGLNDFHDTPYFLACEKYTKAVGRFHANYEQLFDNETFEEYCLRCRRNWDKSVARQKPRGGCFVLCDGGTERMIVCENK